VCPAPPRSSWSMTTRRREHSRGGLRARRDSDVPGGLRHRSRRAGRGEATVSGRARTSRLPRHLRATRPVTSLRELYGASLPIVFLTGHRVRVVRQGGGLLVGADDYLLEPRVAGRAARAGPRAPRALGVRGRWRSRAASGEVINLLADVPERAGRSPSTSSSAPGTAAKHIEEPRHEARSCGSRAHAVAKAYRLRLI